MITQMICACVTAALALSLSVPQAPDGTMDDRRPSIDWTSVDAIVRIIMESPTWEQLARGEPQMWDRLFKSAKALQLVEFQMLETAFIAYMVHSSRQCEGDLELWNQWSRPMLLLRIMFEIDGSKRPVFSTRAFPCGGLPFTIDESIKRRSVEFPFVWENGEPALIAFPRKELPDGGHDQAYQPSRELRYMLTHHRFRDLSALCVERMESWKDYFGRSEVEQE